MRENPSNSIYYFPLVLEFYSPVWSVKLLFICSFSWSSGPSGGGACCDEFQVSLTGWSFTTPCQGASVSVKLFLAALCSFCFLKAFCATLEDQDKNSFVLISSPRAKRSWSPLFSKPSGISGLHFCMAKLS